jgi:hypothetical protein
MTVAASKLAQKKATNHAHAVTLTHLAKDLRRIASFTSHRQSESAPSRAPASGVRKSRRIGPDESSAIVSST